MAILHNEFIIACESVDLTKLKKGYIHKWERIFFISSFTLEWYDFRYLTHLCPKEGTRNYHLNWPLVFALPRGDWDPAELA